MKKVGYVLCLVCVAVMLMSCATIFHPSRQKLTDDERNGLDWGMIILDVLFTPFIVTGILVDCATGCIYLPKRGVDMDAIKGRDKSSSRLLDYQLPAGCKVVSDPLDVSFPMSFRLNLDDQVDESCLMAFVVKDENGVEVAKSNVISTSSDSKTPVAHLKQVAEPSSARGTLVLRVDGIEHLSWPVIIR